MNTLWGYLEPVINVLLKKQTMKKIIILFSLFLVSCGTLNNGEEINLQLENTENNIIQVSSSIIPISSIINTIGWEFVEVHTIVPAWVSPHGFDLSAKDVVSLEDSDITFLLGLEQIDSFLKKPLESKKYVELAEGMKLIEAAAHNHDEEEDSHEENIQEEEHTEDEHSVDPHVWLWKNNILLIAERIRDELSAISPEKSSYFNENTEIFRKNLEGIYQGFSEKNTWKTAKEFIVFHDAYNYLIESIGINPSLKIPFSENVLHETGTAHMAELIQEIEIHGVKNIFREPQFSDGNLQKFATEYNLIIATLDPIWIDDSADGYLKNLQNNLDNLSFIYE